MNIYASFSVLRTIALSLTKKNLVKTLELFEIDKIDLPLEPSSGKRTLILVYHGRWVAFDN